jgi:hypothetical protein
MKITFLLLLFLTFLLTITSVVVAQINPSGGAITQGANPTPGGGSNGTNCNNFAVSYISTDPSMNPIRSSNSTPGGASDWLGLAVNRVDIANGVPMPILKLRPGDYFALRGSNSTCVNCNLNASDYAYYLQSSTSPLNHYADGKIYGSNLNPPDGYSTDNSDQAGMAFMGVLPINSDKIGLVAPRPVGGHLPWGVWPYDIRVFYTLEDQFNAGGSFVIYTLGNNGERCYLQINMSNPTPWKKLKDASYLAANMSNTLDNTIPATTLPYDSEDAVGSKFLSNNSGIVLGTVNVGPSAKVSEHGWVNTTYTIQRPVLQGIRNYIDYIKARKQYTQITSLSDIHADGVYAYANTNPDLTISAGNMTTFNSYNIVLIVPGMVTINMPIFHPTKSTLIAALTTGNTGSIHFLSSTTEADGIFIADTIDTGDPPFTTTNNNPNPTGLKIKGNILTNSLVTNRSLPPMNDRPALYIVYDPSQLINLLPFFSTSTYEWKQVQ